MVSIRYRGPPARADTCAISILPLAEPGQLHVLGRLRRQLRAAACGGGQSRRRWQLPVSWRVRALDFRLVACSHSRAAFIARSTNGLFPIGSTAAHAAAVRVLPCVLTPCCLADIFYDSFMARFGRAEGAAAFTFFIFAATNFTGILTVRARCVASACALRRQHVAGRLLTLLRAAQFTCATRFFYSFARDGGFPFSKKLAYVEPRTGIPVNCVALLLVSVIALATAILTENWFAKINAVCSTISNGFLFTYGVPPLLRLFNSKSFAPHANCECPVFAIAARMRVLTRVRYAFRLSQSTWAASPSRARSLAPAIPCSASPPSRCRPSCPQRATP